MKSLTKINCELCNDTGYVTVKCLIEDYKRNCPCCNGAKKDNESKRRKDDRRNN